MADTRVQLEVEDWARENWMRQQFSHNFYRNRLKLASGGFFDFDAHLAPHITQAILDGRQPRDLTADKLLAHSRLPLAWHEQRTLLGFG